MRNLRDSWNGLFYQENIWQCMRLNLIIFKHLCQIVTFAIDKTNTRMKASISIQIELTITLSRL